MKTTLKIFTLLFLSFLLSQQNTLAKDPLPLVGDTLVVEYSCLNKYFADPYILLAKPGDYLQFKAMQGEFTIIIVNANEFFEDVPENIAIHIDATGQDAPQESDIYLIKNDAKVGSDIRCIPTCFDTGKTIVDAPPKIIITPND